MSFVFHIIVFSFYFVTRTQCLSVSASVELAHEGFSITEFVSKNGYPIEAHINIKTKDGYLLDMFRIPHGRGENSTDSNVGKPAVLLMHGLLGSAENWIVLGPKKALAFILADRGYDVWLGNARGSMHSRKHIELDPDSDRQFWHFSWHEIGVYDLPAKIDYILEETSQNSLYYIGHSQGTTCFFVMASDVPSYNTKIKLMSALAPAAFMSHIPNLSIQLSSTFLSSLSLLGSILSLDEIVPNNELLKLAGEAACLERAIFRELCANLLFLVAGYDSDQLDRSLLPLLTKTSPGGASIRQAYHYAQEVRTGRFQHYDHGTEENLKRYGRTIPPSYDLKNVTSPVAIFYAANDKLVSTKDVDQLASTLPNVALKYLIPYQAFNHLDFVVARDAPSLVYEKIIEVMEQYK